MLVLVAYFPSGLLMPEEGTQPFPVTNYGKLPVYFARFFQRNHDCFTYMYNKICFSFSSTVFTFKLTMN